MLTTGYKPNDAGLRRHARRGGERAGCEAGFFFLQGGGEAKGNEEFQADAVCLLSWVCFIKPVAPEIPPFFPLL